MFNFTTFNPSQQSDFRILELKFVICYTVIKILKGELFMWTRTDLKEMGKQDFKRDYWLYVLVSVIVSICLGKNFNYKFNEANSFFVTMGSLTTLLGILLLNPLYVGTRRFFLSNIYKDGKTSLDTLGYAFKKNYGNVVLTMFLKQLFLILWTCLFVIPGIIKLYSYFMVDYILADNPSIDQSRAFEISKRTMDGEKLNVFVLHLSFIPWYLLTAITAGIAGVFYVFPYVEATQARLYDCLKEKAITNGYATYEDFNC